MLKGSGKNWWVCRFFKLKRILHLQQLMSCLSQPHSHNFLPPCTFFHYYPIHSDIGPDWILIPAYQWVKEKKGTAVSISSSRKETRICVHKMKLLRIYPGWKKLLLFFTILSLVIGKVCKCWCQYSVRASSECCCTEPGSSDVTLSPLSQPSAAAPELCHQFQTILKNPYNSIYYCLYRCLVLF